MHTRIEEDIFYPAVQWLGDSELNRQVREALQEHNTVKHEVAAIRDTLAAHADVDDLVTQLEEDVEHHATEEEDEMFPRLEELMPENERKNLANRMMALKQAAPGTARSAPDIRP